ncbi:L10-interacting MYB domain-containing protein-like [Populus nigra]|uniref:L10-interacting MYB domain-containing protein-like n=1 Tax=Populus nigra TaxID=3691 RepID=UPI002B270C76|nr:L10-interacting MYB domain-containing protein-like [Populus nigra]
MDDSQSQDKACWTREMLHAFCDICIKAIEQGMRPNTHFDKAGWKYVMNCFKNQTGHALTKAQLKNKWDGIKKDWRIWKKLISETGVGWSAELGTIAAPDEWWKAKNQEIRGARKFRHVGIDPTLCCKYDIMFTNTVATGQYAWAPSQGLNSDEDGVGQRQTNAVNEDPHLQEGSGDSEEDSLPNFVADVNNMVAGVNFSNSTSNPTSSSGKRKGVQQSSQQNLKKKRAAGRGSHLLSRLDKLVDSVSTKSECTSTVLDKKGCSIEEVMKEFHSIEEVVFDSELYCFATEFFMVRSRREMWAAMGDVDRKFQWLKLMFDRRATYRP